MYIASAAAWWHWVKRGWPLWGSLLLAACGLVAWSLAAHTQTTLRRIGLVYEVLGVVAVLVEMATAMRRHGIAWPPVQLLRYLCSIPVRRPRDFTFTPGGGGIGFTGHAPVVFQSGAPSPTLEERVEALERRATELHQHIEQVDNRVATEERARIAAIGEEAARREQQGRRLDEGIRAIEVGSFELSLLGLLWLLVGMILTTGTQEVCEWVLRCAG